MAESTNKDKSNAGVKNKNKIEKICQRLKTNGVIQDFEKISNHCFCHTENGKVFEEKQYHPHFILTDNRDGKILIFSSSSFRTDRFYGNLWQAEGVSHHTDISNEVVASYFVVDDSIKEKTEEFASFERTRNLIENGKIYSPIQQLFTQTEFIDYLEDLAVALEARNKSDEESNSSLSNFNLCNPVGAGSASGKRGNVFVKLLSDELNKEEFLNNYKDHLYAQGNLAERSLDKLFSSCLKDSSVGLNDILYVTGNTYIKHNGPGLPKTDLSVTLHLKNGKSHQITFSSKVSDKPSVSCHDYSVEEYIKILCTPDANESLKVGLRLFANLRGWNEVKKKDSKLFESVKDELGQKRKILIDWALKGLTPKVSDESESVAKYLIIVNPPNDKIRVCSMDDYKKILLKRESKQEVPPFSWTYPSKSKNDRIVLKVPLIYE